MTETTRAYIYRILIALGTIATGYGLITADEVALWLGLATTVLNIMPAANTKIHPDVK
jgi:hypothetical protein